jgi:hypothetical protein
LFRNIQDGGWNLRNPISSNTSRYQFPGQPFAQDKPPHFSPPGSLAPVTPIEVEDASNITTMRHHGELWSDDIYRCEGRDEGVQRLPGSKDDEIRSDPGEQRDQTSAPVLLPPLTPTPSRQRPHNKRMR